jgi:hypothetical protein
LHYFISSSASSSPTTTDSLLRRCNKRATTGATHDYNVKKNDENTKQSTANKNKIQRTGKNNGNNNNNNKTSNKARAGSETDEKSKLNKTGSVPMKLANIFGAAATSKMKAPVVATVATTKNKKTKKAPAIAAVASTKKKLAPMFAAATTTNKPSLPRKDRKKQERRQETTTATASVDIASAAAIALSASSSSSSSSSASATATATTTSSTKITWLSKDYILDLPPKENLEQMIQSMDTKIFKDPKSDFTLLPTDKEKHSYLRIHMEKFYCHCYTNITFNPRRLKTTCNRPGLYLIVYCNEKGNWTVNLKFGMSTTF